MGLNNIILTLSLIVKYQDLSCILVSKILLCTLLQLNPNNFDLKKRSCECVCV